VNIVEENNVDKNGSDLILRKNLSCDQISGPESYRGLVYIAITDSAYFLHDTI
jgi:hypothetical protein